MKNRKVHSAKQRAVDIGRRYVPADGRQPGRCVFDLRNFQLGRVELLHLDGLPESVDDYKEGDLEIHGIIDEFSVSPSRKLASAVDLGSWLDSLDESDVRLLEARAAGFSLSEIAVDAGVSLSKVHHWLKALGMELATNCGIDFEAIERRKEKQKEPGSGKSGRPKELAPFWATA